MSALNVQNRTLFQGDNLPVLKGINSSSIDLIATDPPFNKSRDFHAVPNSLSDGAGFQDRWNWSDDEHQQWQNQIMDTRWTDVAYAIELARSCHSDDMGAFLSFMAVRLIECHRILKPSGSIYIHTDDTANAYIRILMDAIFGQDSFQNEIVWKRHSGRSDAVRYGRVHDTILFYAGTDYVWNKQYLPHNPDYVKSHYRHNDDDGRGRYRVSDLTAPGVSSGLSGQTWRGINPADNGRHWSAPTSGQMSDWIQQNAIPDWPDAYPSIHNKLDALDKHSLIFWPDGAGRIPGLKRYLSSSPGRVLDDTILDIPPLQHHSREKVGYPTQKPLALYDRLIRSSTNRNDVVLDPFAGCATTCVSAERAGRQWIGIDLWPDAYQVIRQRFLDENLAVDDDDNTTGTLTLGHIHHLTEPPERTDQLDAADVPVLETPTGRPARSRLTGRQKSEMKQKLLADNPGLLCSGCDYGMPTAEQLVIDHKWPFADGGGNDLDNLCLLCYPCNGKKSNTLTLTLLRKQNYKQGSMAPGHKP